VQIIRPHGGWPSLELADLWRYRDLLYFLVRRDVRVRYANFAVAWLWAVLPTVSTVIIFHTLLARWANVEPPGGRYVPFLLAGLVVWTYFATALTRSVGSLEQNAHLIGKVYFPRLLIPLAATLAALADLAVAAVVLLPPAFWWYGLPLRADLLMLPMLIAVAGAVALGAGLALGAVNLRYREVRPGIPFLVQVWMFASPVVWPAEAVPETLRPWLPLNPMTGVMLGARSAILGLPWDGPALAASVAWAAVLLIAGAYYFRRREHTFAEMR
jgi:lipopolysaccharide transport system permease protein